MSGQPTAGPWRVEENGAGEYWVVSETAVDRDGLPVVIARIVTTEADAQLVAGARDLVQAIRPYLAFLRAKSETGWCMHDRQVTSPGQSEPRWDALEAAIARIEGGDS